jgi:hypothetical protein
MANPVIDNLSRQERRRLLAAEQKARKAGVWPAWETKLLPNGTGGIGWNEEVRVAYRNRIFAVLERPLENGGKHLAVSSLSGVRPTWHEMQRIKDELAGPEALAVEIYPPNAEIVDEADMFHIWVVCDRDAAPFDQFTIFSPRP